MKTLACLFLAVLATGCLAAPLKKGTFQPFKRSLNTTAHGYQVMPDPTGTSPSPVVELFEVRPGDCSQDAGGWNDCQTDRERSELSEAGKDTRPGSEWWYGWSLFVPGDYPNVFPAKVALGQFHQVSGPPVFMFQNSSGGLGLDRHVGGHSVQFYPLIAEPDLRGRWHRFEVHAGWSKGSDGFFRVWVNGELRAEHMGQNMSAELAYFKYGVYRSFLSRYKAAKNKDSVPTQAAYYANVRRGAARQDLLPERP